MTSDPTPFLDGQAVRVHPGVGIVARHPGLILVMPVVAPGQAAAADRLLEICDQSAGEAPGRRVARRVAGVLSETDPDDVPGLCVLAEGAGTLIVILAGDVDLVVVGPRPLQLSGADAVSWVERILSTEVDEISVRASSTPAPAPAALSGLDLRLGTVLGGGVTLLPRRGSVPAAVQPPPPPQALPPMEVTVTGLHAIADPADHEEAANATLAASPEHEESDLGSVMLVDLTIGDDPDDAPREPLPLTTEEPKQPPPDGPLVVVPGIVCSRGHFNNPMAAYCSVCGISMVQRTHEYISGPRPPLGVLVFDDGATFALAGDYVLGRSPAGDDAVRNGRARPLVVEDAEDAVSRVHAEIHLEQWQVFISDRGSANGTYLATDGSTWHPLPPATPTLLPPGTRVQIGRRTFVFDTHHKI